MKSRIHKNSMFQERRRIFLGLSIAILVGVNVALDPAATLRSEREIAPQDLFVQETTSTSPSTSLERPREAHGLPRPRPQRSFQESFDQELFVDPTGHVASSLVESSVTSSRSPRISSSRTTYYNSEGALRKEPDEDGLAPGRAPAPPPPRTQHVAVAYPNYQMAASSSFQETDPHAGAPSTTTAAAGPGVDPFADEAQTQDEFQQKPISGAGVSTIKDDSWAAARSQTGDDPKAGLNDDRAQDSDYDETSTPPGGSLGGGAGGSSVPEQDAAEPSAEDADSRSFEPSGARTADTSSSLLEMEKTKNQTVSADVGASLVPHASMCPHGEPLNLTALRLSDEELIQFKEAQDKTKLYPSAEGEIFACGKCWADGRRNLLCVGRAGRTVVEIMMFFVEKMIAVPHFGNFVAFLTTWIWWISRE